MLCVATVMGRQAGETGQPHTFAFRVDVHGVVDEVFPEDLGDSGQVRITATRGRPAERLPVGPRTARNRFPDKQARSA